MNFLKDIKYSEILSRNSEIAPKNSAGVYPIAVLSNIMVHQSKEIIECLLRENGIPAVVTLGGYDNIVQDSFSSNNAKAVIIFWEACNLVNGLYSCSELLNPQQMDEIVEKTKSEIDLVLKNLAGAPLILFNRFSPLPFTHTSIAKTNLEKITDRLNEYLEKREDLNLHLINTDKIFAAISLEKSVNLRYFYSSMTLYSIEFFKKYSEFVMPFVFAANGKSKKALIFDCDNTLWKGILGESGFSGVEMSPNSASGKIFNEVQNIAMSLNRKGILLGLCSKNNPEDVDLVIGQHPDMVLRKENLSIKKVNWNDKVSNLRAIAEELNIGMNSIVFVDDSEFEVNLIKENLPQVCVIQVPKNLHDYPNLLKEQSGLFFNLSNTSEDLRKAEIYNQQFQREEARKEFDSIENYLESLNMKLKIYHNDSAFIARASQLTQKTNQFNLTTQRYTETEIKRFIDDENYELFLLEVSDKFGNNGITGLSILKLDGEAAAIDSFLMSCRIIGRNIEFAFMDFMMKFLKEKGIKSVEAKYIQTLKNQQVENFYDRCSFEPADISPQEKLYSMNLNNYKEFNIKYFEVIYG